MYGNQRAPATGLFMLCSGAGTAISIGLHGGTVTTAVAIAAVTTSGFVGLVGVLAVNFPAIQRALSVAGIRRAVVRGQLPLEKAIALIKADDDDAPVEQPPETKVSRRSLLRWVWHLRS
jgi:hypothetical protein